MKHISFFFDYLSPFAFFAWRRLPELQALGSVELVPVPMGALFNHWGIKGPGEIAPKREFLLKGLLRRAAREGFDFTTPKTHPFNSLYALRLSLAEVAGANQAAVVAALWKAGWQERIDMGEPDELLGALRAAGLPAEELYEKSFAREAKTALKENLQRGIEHGVFGVPSFVVEGELFWGEDALADLRAFVRGEDRLDREKFQRLVGATPRGI
jgi:2-hydroxychromene-2-carboxylate isomerase